LYSAKALSVQFVFFLRREVQLFEEEFGCFKKIMGSVLIIQGGRFLKNQWLNFCASVCLPIRPNGPFSFIKHHIKQNSCMPFWLALKQCWLIKVFNVFFKKKLGSQPN